MDSFRTYLAAGNTAGVVPKNFPREIKFKKWILCTAKFKIAFLIKKFLGFCSGPKSHFLNSYQILSPDKEFRGVAKCIHRRSESSVSKYASVSEVVVLTC